MTQSKDGAKAADEDIRTGGAPAPSRKKDKLAAALRSNLLRRKSAERGVAPDSD